MQFKHKFLMFLYFKRAMRQNYDQQQNMTREEVSALQ